MLMSEMSWEVQQGKCTRVNAYQRNDGSTVANIDIAYAGGTKSCRISPRDVDRYVQYEGKSVKASGTIETQQMGRDDVDVYVLAEISETSKSHK